MKLRGDSYQKIANFLTRHDDFLLIAHDKPDGDTIASVLALYLFLKRLGKKVSLVCKSPVPKVFGFLKGVDQFRQDFLFGDYQAIILLDNGDLKRTGFADRLKKYQRLGKPIVNIDHHPQNDVWKIATLNLAEPEASSTAEILYEILKRINPFFLDSAIATALLTGIYTDTGGFRHPTTTPKIFELASKLLSFGGNLKQISKNLSGHRDISTLKLWGLALKNITVNRDYGIMTSVLTQTDIKKTGCDEEDLNGVVNMMNSVPRTKIVLLLYETKDGNIRGSLRTDSDDVDVSVLAEVLGGGGHRRASGFSLPGRLVKKEGKIEIV